MLAAREAGKPISSIRKALVSGGALFPSLRQEYKDRGITVLQAISLAGGLSEKGSSRRLKVVRTVDGKRTEEKVDLADTIEAGDTLVVPQRLL